MAKDQVSKPSNAGGKAKKKKWSKGKTKEKSNNAVVIDKETYAKILKEVPTYKLITHGVLVDRMKINASVARSTLIDLEAKGLIKKVSHSSKLCIYTRATAAVAAAEESAAAVKA